MLDKITRSLLVYIREHGVVTDSDIKEHFKSELLSEISVLQKEKFISTTIIDFETIHGIPVNGKHSYEITPAGRAYLENRLSEKAFRLAPIIISVLSLLLSLYNTLEIHGII